jgi:hypothetical protein
LAASISRLTPTFARHAAILFLGLATIGCSRERDRRDSAASIATSTAAVAPPAAAADTGCPRTGRWAACNVFERLDRSGLAPRLKSDTAREPALSVPGSVYTLGSAELRVFLYPDRAAQERDAARLDRTHYVSADAPLTLRGEQTLIRSENLIAILTSRSDTQRERVANAVEAGPPR